jgi:hypothetical protein
MSARVPVATQARGYAWIESGYTWLLWGGGIFLFVAFFVLLFVVLRRGVRLAGGPGDPIGVVGRALVVAFGVMAVLMFFDPHLTYRGSADSLFLLMALSGVRRTAPSQRTPVATSPKSSRTAERT